jgi:hypothetical protein
VPARPAGRVSGGASFVGACSAPPARPGEAARPDLERARGRGGFSGAESASDRAASVSAGAGAPRSPSESSRSATFATGLRDRRLLARGGADAAGASPPADSTSSPGSAPADSPAAPAPGPETSAGWAVAARPRPRPPRRRRLLVPAEAGTPETSPSALPLPPARPAGPESGAFTSGCSGSATERDAAPEAEPWDPSAPSPTAFAPVGRRRRPLPPRDRRRPGPGPSALAASASPGIWSSPFAGCAGVEGSSARAAITAGSSFMKWSPFRSKGVSLEGTGSMGDKANSPRPAQLHVHCPGVRSGPFGSGNPRRTLIRAREHPVPGGPGSPGDRDPVDPSFAPAGPVAPPLPRPGPVPLMGPVPASTPDVRPGEPGTSDYQNNKLKARFSAFSATSEESARRPG